MLLQTPLYHNVFEMKGCQEIPAVLVDAELAQAEKRLETWENKSYYQKVASLAKMADMLPDNTDKLSVLIKAEIDSLLAQSYREIALL
jgi:acyl-CoA reductase-like NAD-dependent aldehyde dehydrogenase